MVPKVCECVSGLPDVSGGSNSGGEGRLRQADLSAIHQIQEKASPIPE